MNYLQVTGKKNLAAVGQPQHPEQSRLPRHLAPQTNLHRCSATGNPLGSYSTVSLQQCAQHSSCFHPFHKEIHLSASCSSDLEKPRASHKNFIVIANTLSNHRALSTNSFSTVTKGVLKLPGALCVRLKARPMTKLLMRKLFPGRSSITKYRSKQMLQQP